MPSLSQLQICEALALKLGMTDYNDKTDEAWVRSFIEKLSEADGFPEYESLSRGIEEGDVVRVFNKRGEMLIPAEVTERIMPGVVAIPQGAWYKWRRSNSATIFKSS
jgi:formylmethanofuran dehydrogenase subunit D